MTVFALSAGGEDTVLLDVGSMTAKHHLGYGWSLAERTDDRTFRWMKSLEAQVWVDLASPGADRTIRVEAAPQFLPYTRQVLAVYVNRRFAGEWKMAHRPGFAPYRLAVPSRFWRAGQNEILLRAAYRVSVGSDSRELSVGIDSLAVEAD